MNQNPFEKSQAFLAKNYSNRKGLLRTTLLYDDLAKLFDSKLIESVADIGCGSAPITGRLIESKKIKKAYLFDPSKELLDIAQKEINSSSTDTIFAQKDFEASITFLMDNPADLIIYHGVLNWLESPLEALRKLNSLCDHSGSTVSLMLGASTGYILELATNGDLAQIASILKDGYTQSESYPDKKLYLFKPLQTKQNLINAGMQIVAKSGVRNIFDLAPAKQKSSQSEKEWLELERSLRMDEEYWHLGDMIHFIYHK